MLAKLQNDLNETVSLASLKKGDRASVSAVVETESPDSPNMKRRLLELGFVPGEKIRLIAESFPSRDPIAVRVGNTTFALRRHEAAMVRVIRIPG